MPAIMVLNAGSRTDLDDKTHEMAALGGLIREFFCVFEPISVAVPRVYLEARRFGKEAGKRKPISVAVPRV